MTTARFAIVVPDACSEKAGYTIISLLDQLYQDWVIYVENCDEASFQRLSRLVGKNRLFAFESGIASVPSEDGLYVLPLCPGDELLPDALALMALQTSQAETAPKLIYCDHVEPFSSTTPAPFFKPGWSPEFLMAKDYIGRAAVTVDAFNKAEIPTNFDAVDLWGLWLQHYSLKDHEVIHVERPSLSLAQLDKVQVEALAPRAGKQLEDHFATLGIVAKAVRPKWAQRLGSLTFNFSFEDEGPKVSLLIPSRNNRDVLKRCIDSLALTTYKNFEAIVIDNFSDEPKTVQYINALKDNPPANVRVVSIASPKTGFSYSYINNEGVRFTTGEYLLFLNDDTEVIRPEWLSQMVGWARVPGIASVGARLYFPDDLVQHNGLVNQLLDKVLPAPAFKLTRRRSIASHGQDLTVRNYSAVTAACMLTPRSLFVESGGFNDTNYSVAYNDCDYGFRLTQEGWRHVCVPTAELYHYEGSSRGRGKGNDKISEEIAFIRQYSDWVDPYYNSNLSKNSLTFEPSQRVNMGTEVSNSRFSVGLFSHNLNYEGAPLVLLDIARGLVSKMAQVVVFSLVDGPLRNRFEEIGCKVVVQTDVGVFGTRSVEELNSAVEPIVGEILRAGLDVVIANTVLTHWGLRAAEIAGVPSIWVIHESEPPFHHLREHGEHHVQIGQKAFEQAYLNVFVCYATMELYKPLAKRDNLEVIYNGFDRRDAEAQMALYDRDQERAALGVEAEEVLFLLPGTVCARKSQKDLVHALATLPTEVANNSKFVIVGDRDSEYSRELHYLISNLSSRLQQKIKVIKETPEIWRYYVAADVLAFTSRLESFPRVIQEAMHRGMAIISTPVFGISEQLRDGQSGLLYNPGDIDGLVKAISRLTRDSSLRKKLGDMGKMSLDRFPSIERMQEIYTGIAKEAFMTGNDKPAFGSGLPWLSSDTPAKQNWWNSFRSG